MTKADRLIAIEELRFLAATPAYRGGARAEAMLRVAAELEKRAA